jgi:actin-related protein
LFCIARCVQGFRYLQVSFWIKKGKKWEKEAYFFVHRKQQHLKNTIVQEYVLPDFINDKTGHIRPSTETAAGRNRANNAEQILMMNNERFMIPEVLMHPSDIGLDQAGIPEAITQSVLACDSCKINRNPR